MKINTALILCAGYGKRLNQLTINTPKPLLKIDNLTLLERSINLIKDLGIKKVRINTFYLKDQINIFVKNRDFNIEIEIIEDGKEILETGGGIFNMMKDLNEDHFLVLNPDTLWNNDYLQSIIEMEKFYFENKAKNILMVVNKMLSFDKNLKGDFILANHKLTKNNQANFIYLGCQIIDKNLFQKIDDKIFSISKIWNNLLDKNELYGFENKNKFYHATNFEIYQKLLRSY